MRSASSSRLSAGHAEPVAHARCNPEIAANVVAVERRMVLLTAPTLPEDYRLHAQAPESSRHTRGRTRLCTKVEHHLAQLSLSGLMTLRMLWIRSSATRNAMTP